MRSSPEIRCRRCRLWNREISRRPVRRCRLAAWLPDQGHDALFSDELGVDPSDRALLEHAASEGRILVTIDADFGELVFVHRVSHAGLVRLPDVPMARRILVMEQVLERHREALEAQAIITVRGERIRVSYPPSL